MLPHNNSHPNEEGHYYSDPNSADTEFNMIMEGDNCNRLDSIQACENAAEYMGLPDTSCLRFADPRYPPYCYYKNVTDRAGRKGLKFNFAKDTSVPCSPLRPCICQISSEYFSRYSASFDFLDESLQVRYVF